MKALGMKRRWREPEWLWIPRWIYLLIFMEGLLGLAMVGIIGNWHSEWWQWYLGIICILVGTLYLRELIKYAIRRVRVGKKYHQRYG